MVCNDRQLTEAQRVAGYQNQRTGVARAVRPFSGSPTIPNLIDYINRELIPVVKASRDAVNDVFLHASDNAPSANPLGYYFATETANADPTAGRLRLDASPQNTATTIRLSQSNGRLQDVTSWLSVMAGGATTPLGVVTLSDAINPGRFIRCDLDTMTDQGDYWDLGITIVESSHDDPFVDDEAIVVSFIPGVASSGATVPVGSLSPIGANTVLGNPTALSAAPTEIAVGTNTVLGRVAGNIVAATLVTDQVTNDAITDTKLRNSGALSVVGRSANSSGDPADISATASTGAVLRESGSALGFGTVANAGLANMTAGTVKGRQIDAGTGAPVDLTGLEIGELIRIQTTQSHSQTGASQTITLNGDATVLTKSSGVSVNIIGITGGAAGRMLFLRHSSGGGSTTTIEHDSGSTATDGIICPGGVPFVFGSTFGTSNYAAFLIYNSTAGRWLLFPRGFGRDEDVDWGGDHSFTGASFDVDVTAAANFVSNSDMGIGSTAGGLSLGAGAVGTFIYQSTSVGNGDVVMNASGGVAITAGLATGAATATDDMVYVEADNIQLAGSVLFSQRARFNAVLSTTVTGNLDNLDVSAYNVVRFSPDTSARNLTGMVAGADGQMVILVVASSGSQTFRFVDESDGTLGTNSTAANRFKLAGTTSLTGSAQSIWLAWYDGTSDRWRIHQ